jgi:hypothetical protein
MSGLARRDLARGDGLSPAAGGGLYRPDWVMCGTPHADGVMVIASKRLSRAELEMRARYQDMYGGYTPVASALTSMEITLTTWLGPDTLRITGPDYPAVMEELFRTWSPGEPVRPAIEG